MSQNLTISETGLKLIKAFEGYRPVDRELISGQRIVGYGHRLYSEDAVIMDKSEAEETLMADLAPFEDMINTEVHAPLSQSQFDALCSFAFNIGPKAFLQSDTLRAINNGRPLDAANGLDIWRKSEIDGKTYVVDALMRRRTAEKALFLRTKRDLPAGRMDIPPVRDTAIATMSTEDALPVFTESDANGIVATAPYDANVSPMRRQEDRAAGALQLSERDIIDGQDSAEEADIVDFQNSDTQDTDVQTADVLDTDYQDNEITPEIEDGPLEPLDLGLDLDLDLDLDLREEYSEPDTDTVSEPESRKSPIAAAATDIVARLDALIEDADARFEDSETDGDWANNLIEADENETLQEVIESSAVDENQVDENQVDENQENGDFQQIAAENPGDKQDGNENVIQLDRGQSQGSEDMYVAGDTPVSQGEDPVAVIDELAQDDAFKIRTDSAAKYIESTQPLPLHVEDKDQGGFGLWVLVLLGFTLVGLAVGALMKGSQAILGDWGPIISFSGFVIGICLILAGIYAALRINRSR